MEVILFYDYWEVKYMAVEAKENQVYPLQFGSIYGVQLQEQEIHLVVWVIKVLDWNRTYYVPVHKICYAMLLEAAMMSVDALDTTSLGNE